LKTTITKTAAIAWEVLWPKELDRSIIIQALAELGAVHIDCTCVEVSWIEKVSWDTEKLDVGEQKERGEGSNEGVANIPHVNPRSKRSTIDLTSAQPANNSSQYSTIVAVVQYNKHICDSYEHQGINSY